MWLVGNRLSYADFRMATFLPFNDVAGLPLEDHPSVARWYRRLEEIEAWRDPFKGLDAPALPRFPVKHGLHEFASRCPRKTGRSIPYRR